MPVVSVFIVHPALFDQTMMTAQATGAARFFDAF
jgi:hypothetical protein